METRMFLCFHANFLHLEFTFTPHYIITDKSLLGNITGIGIYTGFALLSKESLLGSLHTSLWKQA